MSAVIVQFPRNARADRNRRKAVEDAVIERARATNATSAQLAEALKVAKAEYLRTGGSASWAIWKGKEQLPQLQRVSYRTPQPPKDAA